MAEQLYTLADVSRLLKVGEDRLRVMIETDEMLPHDIVVPGGAHKGKRWSASRVAAIQRAWTLAGSAQRTLSA